MTACSGGTRTLQGRSGQSWRAVQRTGAADYAQTFHGSGRVSARVSINLHRTSGTRVSLTGKRAAIEARKAPTRIILSDAVPHEQTITAAGPCSWIEPVDVLRQCFDVEQRIRVKPPAK